MMQSSNTGLGNLFLAQGSHDLLGNVAGATYQWWVAPEAKESSATNVDFIFVHYQNSRAHSSQAKTFKVNAASDGVA